MTADLRTAAESAARDHLDAWADALDDVDDTPTRHELAADAACREPWRSDEQTSERDPWADAAPAGVQLVRTPDAPGVGVRGGDRDQDVADEARIPGGRRRGLPVSASELTVDAAGHIALYRCGDTVTSREWPPLHCPVHGEGITGRERDAEGLRRAARSERCATDVLSAEEAARAGWGLHLAGATP